MSEGQPIPRIFLPESEDPTVKALKDANLGDKLGAKLIFGEPGTTLEEAAEMLNRGEFEILVAGAAHTSSDLLRVAIHKIGAPEKFISSFFIMEKDGEEPMFFADCAVHEKPNPDQLVKIAEQTCESVSHLGYDPVVAFLSLSTFGSADHLESVKPIKEAAEKFREKNPDITAYGEVQVDAAMDPEILKKKAGGRGIELIEGKMPNVFIFPDGQSGNIGYKLVEQVGGRVAVGPMLTGVAKDMHDLSRGVTLNSLVRSCEVAAQLYRARHSG